MFAVMMFSFSLTSASNKWAVGFTIPLILKAFANWERSGKQMSVKEIDRYFDSGSVIYDEVISMYSQDIRKSVSVWFSIRIVKSSAQFLFEIREESLRSSYLKLIFYLVYIFL